LARVTELIRGEADFSLAVSMLLTHLLFCLLEVSGMWKSPKPIKTVITEKEHFLILLSFIQLLKRKLWGKHSEKWHGSSQLPFYYPEKKCSCSLKVEK